MASKKFSDFVEKTNENEVDFIVGYSGDENVRIDPSVLSGTTDYNDLTNKPTIPTDNSQLSNGAGYVTTDTNTQRTDQEIRDVIANEGYLTSETDSQTLSISGQELTISNGNTVSIPDTNTQLSDADIAAMGYIKTDTNTQRTDAEIQSIIDTNTAGFLTSETDSQTLSISGSDLSISNGNTVTIPDTNTQLSDADIAAMGYIKTDTDTQRTDQEIRDVIATEGYITSETPQTLSISGQDLTLSDGGGTVTLPSGGGGGGASDLNGLSDCLVDTDSLYVGEVPSGLSGNPQSNTTLGINSAPSLTTGVENTIIGNDAGLGLTSGGRHVMVGFEAGSGMTIGSKGVFVGYQAGKSTTTTNNIESVYIGNQAGSTITGDGSTNVAIGGRSLGAGSTSVNCAGNVSIGWRSMFKAGTGGEYNTCVGRTSGGDITTGTSNVYIGSNAGDTSTTGSNNIAIGSNAIPSSATVSNEITLGDSNITSLRCAVTSITSLSDERDKTEIKDLEYGLDFINALQPREFVWDNRPEIKTIVNDDDTVEEIEFYSANKGKKDFGFIAQELRELDNDTLRLVYTENEDRLEISYGKLVPILVQAVKELKAEVDSLKAQIGN